MGTIVKDLVDLLELPAGSNDISLDILRNMQRKGWSGKKLVLRMTFQFPVDVSDKICK